MADLSILREAGCKRAEAGEGAMEHGERVLVTTSADNISFPGLKKWLRWLHTCYSLENSSSASGAQMEQLIPPCHSSYKGSDTHFWPPQVPHTCVIHSHIHFH